MSEASSSNQGTDESEETMYKCKICDEQFDAAGRDAHRQEHRARGETKSGGKRPGPKSRKKGGPAAADETRSEATIFERLASKSPKKGPAKGTGKVRKDRGITSKKNYNKKVTPTRQKSG